METGRLASFGFLFVLSAADLGAPIKLNSFAAFSMISVITGLLWKELQMTGRFAWDQQCYILAHPEHIICVDLIKKIFI